MNLPFLHLRKDHKKKEMLRGKKEQSQGKDGEARKQTLHLIETHGR